MSLVPDLMDYVENFQRRVMQDALAEATAAYWLHRADTFEAARPRPDDYTETAEERRAKWHELTEIAQACRNRAAVAQMHDGIDPDIEAVWNEAS